EISLAIGEPPATKGYPPSVFARLPQLVERAGNGDKGSGSITAFYTVLVEGDDHNDPIADAARAILDGHILLSRQLAESGHYPAIDVEASISRLAPQIMDKEKQIRVQFFRKNYSLYQQNKDLINVGAYQVGSDAEIDFAIQMQPHLMRFMSQDMNQAVSLTESYTQLEQLLNNQLAKKAQTTTPAASPTSVVNR
ncbi:MAG: flagellum-specific ATP synthase FliI, partial [Gammaproteobacteria bacterium]|nr:flagellum-specific ATP synthase FliI [Gammaproteobacteria bacterium]